MVLYRDIDILFEPNSSGDINLVEDERAVSQAIKSLILTSLYERPFQPSVGSTVNHMLFSPLDNISERVLCETIREVITQFEPRATLKFVEIYRGKGPSDEPIDDNTVTLIIGYLVYNRPSLVTTTIILRRLR